MNHLYLDDVRPAPKGWKLFRTVDQAQVFIEGTLAPYEISLDFDMGMVAEDCATCNNRGWGRLHDFSHPDYCPDCSHVILEYDTSEPTGADFLIWLFEGYGKLPEKIYIHSANPVGRNSMQWLIKDIEKKYGVQYPEAFR
jgi:hypothetical protein